MSGKTVCSYDVVKICTDVSKILLNSSQNQLDYLFGSIAICTLSSCVDDLGQ